MSKENLILLARILIPIGASGLAYAFWRYVDNRNGDGQRQNKVLIGTYIISRFGLWLLFVVLMQDYVTTSDPRLYYIPQLESFLAGNIPIRDFYYPYAPLLMPSMLPFYLLLGNSLGGISLFAIFAEAIALLFLLKIMSLLEQRGEVSHSWLRKALAVYLLNPATLYWTVFQGYHSIVQVAYSMAALYFLLRGYYTTGYAVGLFSLAGAKLLAILDWPALLAVCRPRITNLIWGAVPLLITYVIYQVITGDILFPLRYHVGYTGEGNFWYFTTLFVDLHTFYSRFPGNLLPIFFFGIPFLLGLVSWIRYLGLGRTSFSFQASIGITTYTMCLFFLFSLYTGSYYIPMLMLSASLVVTCPSVPHRHGIWLLLLMSGVGIAGDAIWASFGQPNTLISAFSSDSATRRSLTILWILSIFVRMTCFVMLGLLGLRVARTYPLSRETIASSS